METEVIESVEADHNQARQLGRHNISAIQEEHRYNHKSKKYVLYNVNDLVA